MTTQPQLSPYGPSATHPVTGKPLALDHAPRLGFAQPFGGDPAGLGALLGPGNWPLIKLSIDVGEVLTVPAGFGIIFPGPLTNSGTLINSGKVMVL